MARHPHPNRHLRLVASVSVADPPALMIDCEECAARFTDACDDCLVSYLIGHEAGTPVILDDDEKRAVDLLADAGLVPPSRFRTDNGVA